MFSVRDVARGSARTCDAEDDVKAAWKRPGYMHSVGTSPRH